MASRYKILVDSSVWIDFFKDKRVSGLEQLIAEDLVCTNEIILTELLPNLIKTGYRELVESLLTLENLPLQTDWELLREYRLLNLTNGINHVGIPDLMILQQVIEHKISLYTYDKHFKLMQEYLSFDLFNSY